MKKIIEEKLKELGFSIIVNIEKSESLIEIYRENISLESLGKFALIFTSITAIVSVGYNDLSAKIIIDFQWDHPSGSNGYHTSYLYIEGQWRS